MLQYSKIDRKQRVFNANLPRGDIANFDFKALNYLFEPEDKIILKIGKDLDSPAIYKTFSGFSGEHIEFSVFPEETAALTAGEYFYIIKLVKITRETDTFVEKSLFYVEES
jgi:hypothetical protein